MDIASVVLDIRFSICACNNHIVMCFAVIHGIIMDCIGFTLSIYISNISIGINFSIVYQRQGTAFIGFDASNRIRTKSNCIITGCNGTIPHSRTVLGQSTCPATKSGSTIGAGLRICAKSHGISKRSQCTFPKSKRTATQSPRPFPKGNRLLTSCVCASLRIESESQ